MKKRSFIVIIFVLAIFSMANAGTIKVVTTTMDMKSIAELIGGDKVSVSSIATGLERVDPSNKTVYEKNLQSFFGRIDAKMKEWQAKMAPFKGSKIIAYHNEWVYFETRFGLQVVDFMEPKPGIPPTPSQLVKVINEVKANKIKVIVSSPYFTTS